MYRMLLYAALYLIPSSALAFDDLCPEILEMAKTVVIERDKGIPYEQILSHHLLLSGQRPLNPQTLSYVRFASYHIYSSNMTEKDAINYIMHDFCAVNPVFGY